MDEEKETGQYIYFGKWQESVLQISYTHFVSFASRGLTLTHHSFFIAG